MKNLIFLTFIFTINVSANIAINLSNNDANLFKITKGYPAILNTWNMYDKSNKLVLIDQELTVKPLKVSNYYQ